ncbi:MAG TPA: phage tail protein [Bacteroidia bacterium]|nr:phage tail protein [Bacteroidia bacterium]
MPIEPYPLVTFHFQVEWGGTRIGFTEVTGFKHELEKIDYREGNSPEFFVTKMPGMAKFGNCTLKRGEFRADDEFWIWLTSVQMNKPERRDLTVKLLDEAHVPVITWNLSKCWPSSVEGNSFKSVDNTFAVETIVVEYESFTTVFS